MSTSTNNQKKLLELLKSMFQFEQADLDFGIYRIMNMKREEISKYLNETLIEQISEGINVLVNEQTTENLESSNTSEIESDVYNHLINFFSRYYDDGDFISQRRYKDGVYAIPYEGEEVKLYWANADQYYVKTSEYFNDYTFKTTRGKTVTFKVVDAEIERDNNKANEKKFFCIHKNKPLEIINDELIIYVEYKNGGYRKQEDASKDIIACVKSNLNHIDFNSLTISPKSNEKSELEKQLFRYTAKNTYDYFIHKDLGKFLKRELDFYIKNEVIFLDDIQVDDMVKTKQYLVKAQVIQSVASKLIDFLAQIENFQKKMYLKKKFVVDTQYCITLDRIPEEFYPEIAINDAQREEWVRLFAIDEIKEEQGNLLEPHKIGYSSPLTVEFLKENKFLIVDTKYFSNDFKEKLIGCIDNLDSACDGLLINSENYQALNFLSKKYTNRINCVYVDPPYNTDSSPILYKNNYKDSSWLSLIYDRLVLARKLMSEDSIICQAIDDVELRYLTDLTDIVFDKSNYCATVSILCTPQGRVANKENKISEYTIVHAKDINYIDSLEVQKTESEKKETNFRRSGMNSLREERPLRYYPILEKNNELFMINTDEYKCIYNSVEKRFNEEYIEELEGKYKELGFNVIWPISDGKKHVWQREFDRAQKEYQTYHYRNGNVFTPAFDKEIIKTIWNKNLYSNANYGTAYMNSIIKSEDYDASKNTPKSPYVVKDFIGLYKNDIILDYFAGTGTTGHAVIKWNKEDNYNRKYILVEMGEYFDCVTKTRMKKVIYADNNENNLWQNGKPINRNCGISQVFKYITLESYEDTLNNIKFDNSLNLSSSVKEDYLLKYMMNFETQNSAFNTECLSNPFDYHMLITKKQETVMTKIDVIETFNYLIGLNVEKSYSKESYDAKFSNTEYGALVAEISKGDTYDIKLIKGHLNNGDKVLVIWRNLTDDIIKDNAVLDAILEKKGISSNDNMYDVIYINGDNNLPNINRSRIILIDEEMQKLMFEM